MGVTEAICQQSGTALNTPPLPVEASALIHRFVRGKTPHTVLHEVNLTVRAGETVAVIGRSGSGKSTLLNLLGGLEPVQQGQLNVFGHNLAQLSDHQRTLLRRHQIGFIYQAFNLVPTLSVAENVCLPLALAGIPAARQQERLDRVLDSIGLAGRENEFPDRLSGGEQQRVAIARALIHQPPLLLADEPTGNLDAETGRQVLALLEQLVADQNAAMLLVTHSLEVARIADRTFLMGGGALEQVDREQLASSGAW